MSSPLENFHYVYQDHKSERTLFLLHGTGGDEHDLLPFGQQVSPKYNLVGLRGNISEHGMNRFFKRTAPGVFDQQSILEETTKLAKFLTAWQQQYPHHQFIFLGYSNGANMILALLFRNPDIVSTAILLHPMLPFTPTDLSLQQHRIIVTYGLQDPLIPAQQSLQVIQTLQSLGSQVTTYQYTGGHEISSDEYAQVITTLKEL